MKYIILLLLIQHSMFAYGSQNIFKEGQNIGPEEYIVDQTDNFPTESYRIPLKLKFKLDASEGGNICIAIFDDPDEYERSRADKPENNPNLAYGECIDIKYGTLSVDLEAHRQYAVAVFHDKNRNGILDTTGPFKIPKEGIGFSNNPKIVKSRPKWKKVSFNLSESSNNKVIKLVYFL